MLTFDLSSVVNAQAVPQDYGDNVTRAVMGSFRYGTAQGFTPNIAVSYGNSAPALWTTLYGGLTNVLFEDTDATGVLNITLTAEGSGVNVRLHGFDLAAYTPNAPIDPTINSVTVYDGVNTVLFSQANVTVSGSTQTPFIFNPPLTSTSLRIEINALNLTHGNDDIAADNITFSQSGTPPPGTPAAGEFYWTTFGENNAYGHGSFSWDGVTLSGTTAQLGALPAFTVDGYLAVGADGNIYSGRAGRVLQINPVSGAVQNVGSGVNNNVTSIDPARTTVYVGWSDADLATHGTGPSFGPGAPRDVTGDDGTATGLAWEPNGTVWYTTGGEPSNFNGGVGNVGRINLSTFVTTRVLSSISATKITYDPFTGHLFTSGVNGIAQINPATNTVVSTWLNPRGVGLFVANIEATGQGHLVAFDGDSLRLWDFSVGSGLIGQPDTLKASIPVPLVDGGLAFANVPDFPLIISPLNVTTRVGQPFVYVLETNVPVTDYSAGTNSLPPGLIFNFVPRTITGTVGNQTGTFQVPLSVSNANGTTNTTLTITVLPASTLAIISGTSATGRTGAPFRFQVITNGGSSATRLSAAGLPAGLIVDPATGVISGTPTTDGSFAVTLTASDGNAAATATLQLTFSSDPALPVIRSSSELGIAPGQPVVYQIEAPASGVSDPTVFELVGNLPPGLGFDSSAGQILGIYNPGVATAVAAGKPLSGGVITNVQLFATNSRGTTTLPLVFFLKPAGVVNISTRLAVQTGENVLIGGFIITGNAPKKLLIRAIGPSLPIDGKLQNPSMELYDSNGLLGANDDWRSTQEQEIIETTIPPTSELESAILATLNPGAYTAIVRGAGDGQGVGLVELYDLGTASLDNSSGAQLANISTRGFVQRGDDVMIGGFITTASSKLIVRAIGPSLGAAGVAGALDNTTLEVRDGSGELLAANDDWRSNQEQDIINSTVPPTDNRESAIIATFPSGNYTAIVRGKDDTTGVALVEGYVLP